MYIPNYIKYIIRKLDENGYKSYIVGGSVRDSLLNKKPKDFDVTTSAKPSTVESLFDKVIPTGIKHGTVTVVTKEGYCEVTTMRQDGVYKDNRRPEKVEFTDDINIDLSRRDFTINAMAYDLHNLIDPFNGKGHLEYGLIKCVGVPDDRFQEDALRMMRAVRFASQLEFEIDGDTKKSIKSNSHRIVNISKERIRDELCKILVSKKPSYGIRLLSDLKLLQYILPELETCRGFDQKNPHHDKDVFDHIMKVVDESPDKLPIRLAALFHDIAKPKTFTLDDDGVGHFYGHHKVGAEMTNDILKRLRFDNKTIENVCVLVKEHMSRNPKLRTPKVKKFINRVGEENLNDLFSLQIADIIGHKPPHNFDEVLILKEECERILSEKQPLTIKDLDINGYDLMELGIKPSKKMGEILNKLLDMVLENPEINNKESLLRAVREDILK